MRFACLLALLYSVCCSPSAGALSLPERLTADEIRSRMAERIHEGVPAPFAIVEGPRGPKYTTQRLEGAEFPHSLGIYTAEPDGYTLRFAVYYQSPDHRPFAERAGKLLAVLWGMANRRFSTTLARLREAPVSLWMTRGGEAGAEQHAANLFVYNVLSPRSGIEWARELAHEYGHYLLPGATGYSHPESWSNGMLGERLFTHWLLQDLNGGRISPNSLPFVRRKDVQEYCDRQVFPLLDPMRSRGPQPAVLSGTDERALDAHTGFMLYVDSTYGSPALLQLLEYLPAARGNTPQGIDFLVAFITWVREEPVQTITIPAGGAVMVYLSRGEFNLRQDSGLPGKLSLNAVPVQGSPSEWTIRVPVAGWRLLSLTESGKGSSLRIQRRGAG